MKIIFATQNPDKVQEIQPFISNKIQIQTLADLSFFDEIPETATTIEGNAKLKAQFVYEKFKMNCFADDTGLEVESLNGAPGVLSARYAGVQKSAKDNNLKLLEELKNCNNRKARFKTIIGLFYNDNYFEFSGTVEGEILEKLQGDDGFGYDPLFMPKGYNRTFAEMSLGEKSNISHRGLAMKQLISFLENLPS